MEASVVGAEANRLVEVGQGGLPGFDVQVDQSAPVMGVGPLVLRSRQVDQRCPVGQGRVNVAQFDMAARPLSVRLSALGLKADCGGTLSESVASVLLVGVPALAQPVGDVAEGLDHRRVVLGGRVEPQAFQDGGGAVPVR